VAPQFIPAPKATSSTRSRLEAPVADALVPEQGDGGGGGVAVALDVVDDLLVGQPSTFWQYSLMRMLAWCISTSFKSEPDTRLRFRISWETSIMRLVAILKM